MQLLAWIPQKYSQKYKVIASVSQMHTSRFQILATHSQPLLAPDRKCLAHFPVPVPFRIGGGYRKSDNTNLNQKAQCDYLHDHQWDERGTYRPMIVHCRSGESTRIIKLRKPNVINI